MFLLYELLAVCGFIDFGIKERLAPKSNMATGSKKLAYLLVRLITPCLLIISKSKTGAAYEIVVYLLSCLAFSKTDAPPAECPIIVFISGLFFNIHPFFCIYQYFLFYRLEYLAID